MNEEADVGHSKLVWFDNIYDYFEHSIQYLLTLIASHKFMSIVHRSFSILDS
jgi:hypothetical protein